MSPAIPHSKSNGRVERDAQPIDRPAAKQAVLTLVATPIGHSHDVTLRALEVLRGYDIIACEDTRTTRKLLTLHGIAPQGKLIPYHEHNGARQRPVILALLAQGLRVALVSDAGTPLISDPGYKLVRAAAEAGFAVSAAPGPSALITGLILSGLPTDRFFFGGFLPHKSQARRKILESLKTLDATLIFFESPHRVAESLDDAATMLGNRDAALARELTKYFEEVRRATLDTLRAEARSHPPKGEIVLIIGGAGTVKEDAASANASWRADLQTALSEQSLRDAVEAIAHRHGIKRRDVYNAALTMVAAKQQPKDTND